MSAPYTDEQAIAALKRLAKRWPRSLALFSWSGSLHVMPFTDDGFPAEGTFGESSICTIDGIPNDGGDPD